MYNGIKCCLLFSCKLALTCPLDFNFVKIEILSFSYFQISVGPSPGAQIFIEEMKGVGKRSQMEEFKGAERKRGSSHIIDASGAP